jgi:histo-blood group ABO system transferase
VVQHCGFLNRYGSFEKNFLSKTFVREGTGKNYFGGGFYSFGRDSFFDLAKTCKKMIDEDASNGIVPVWHDESALNRYMLDNPPTRILSPSYHYPENKPKIISTWDKPYECRILLLDKNHNEIRGL